MESDVPNLQPSEIQIQQSVQSRDKSRRIKIVGIFIAAMLLIGGGVYSLAFSKYSLFPRTEKNNTKLLQVDNTWKTYKSREGDFTIEYPTNLQVRESEETTPEEYIGFSLPGETSTSEIYISVYTNWSPSEAIKYVLGATHNEKITSMPITINGVEVKKITMPEIGTGKILPGSIYKTDIVYVFSNDKTYVLKGSSSSDQKQGNAIIDKMVQTLKFTHQGKNAFLEKFNISSWQTYRSVLGGYEIKYPPAYKPEEHITSAEQEDISYVTFEETFSNRFSVTVSAIVDENEYLRNQIEFNMCNSTATLSSVTLQSGKTFPFADGCSLGNMYFLFDKTLNVLAIVQINGRLPDDPFVDAILTSFHFVPPGPNPQLLQQKRDEKTQEQQNALSSPDNAKRRNDVAAISKAINTYVQEKKQIPSIIPSYNALISKDSADICSILVPKYIASLPSDPRDLDQTPITNCNSDYYTDYYIEKTSETSVKVSAPGAEFGEIIESQ